MKGFTGAMTEYDVFKMGPKALPLEKHYSDLKCGMTIPKEIKSQKSVSMICPL